MGKLRSVIKYIKTGNIAIFTLAALLVIVALIWIAFDMGSGKAMAQDTSAQHAAVATTGASNTQSSFAGWGLLAAALSTGLSSIAAGIAVAMVGSAAMGAVAERPEVMGRSIIFVGLAEGIAIYGLIISIMILGKI
jgi:V/A-type H+-transporting ATPase subunit K